MTALPPLPSALRAAPAICPERRSPERAKNLSADACLTPLKCRPPWLVWTWPLLRAAEPFRLAPRARPGAQA